MSQAHPNTRSEWLEPPDYAEPVHLGGHYRCELCDEYDRPLDEAEAAAIERAGNPARCYYCGHDRAEDYAPALLAIQPCDCVDEPS